MFRLIRELIRPYRWQLVVILLAMLVETTMSLAGPWPLRIIIDNVVGNHKMTPWLDHLIRPMLGGGGRLQVAGLAALAFMVIALLGAIATYCSSFRASRKAVKKATHYEVAYWNFGFALLNGLAITKVIMIGGTQNWVRCMRTKQCLFRRSGRSLSSTCSCSFSTLLRRWSSS